MLIFQKNFNATIPAIKSPHLRDKVQLPEGSWMTPPWQSQVHSVNPSNSHRPDLFNSSFNPNLNDSLVDNPVVRAVRRTRAGETDSILIGNAQEQNKSLLNKLIEENDSKEKARAAIGGSTEIIQDVPVITEEIEADDNTLLNKFNEDRRAKEQAELRANTGLVRGKAQEHLDNARAKVGELKGKAVETWGNWSANYGNGLTGSLAGDAALAASGLALAGGAYKLMKKRREKNKAKKEALKGTYKR